MPAATNALLDGPKPLGWLRLLLAVLTLSCCVRLSAAVTEPVVAVLYGSAWSPGDAARDGAAEFEVLLCAARVRQAAALAGIVGVGTRRGSFPPAAEAALERVAHMGVPIVRVAQTGAIPSNDGDVFIEAGGLAAHEAQRLLSECLLRYGPLPTATDPMRPTKKEKAALQGKLALYQFQFDTHNAAPLAMR